MKLRAAFIALVAVLCFGGVGFFAGTAHASGDSDTVTLYVRGQQDVPEQDLLEALGTVEPLKMVVLNDGSIEIALSLKGTSTSQLRERISQLDGVMQVGEMNLAAPVEPTPGVTVPGLDDVPSNVAPPTSSRATENKLSHTGAWWVLGVVGVVSALGGGFILLDDARRRHQRRQFETAFEDEPPAA
jgi:hypothetical protein